MFRSVAFCLGLAVAATVVAAMPVSAFADDATPGRSETVAPQDVLDAEREGLVELRFIANDARSAQVLVTNQGDRPLTLQLPPAFAGVPVLAQMGGGAGGGAGFGSGGIGAPAQSVGGGGAGGGAMGGGAGANPFGCWVAREVYGVHNPRWLEFRGWMTWQAPDMLRDAYAEHGEAFAAWLHDRPVAKTVVRMAMDQALASADRDTRGGQFRVAPPIDNATAPFAVPAGKTVAVRAPTVCLEYGRREPNPRMTYRLVKLDTVSQDPRLATILGAMAAGHVPQKVAQAAAWHLSSGRTWEQLAGEVIKRAGGDPDVAFFSHAELVSAQRAVKIATELVGDQPAAKAPVKSESDSSN